MAEGISTIHEREWKTAQAFTLGSIAEGIGGIAAALAAIIALAGVRPPMLLAVAIIAAGVALVVEGGAIASRFRILLQETAEGSITEIGSGITTEFIGGTAGIILGVLMFLGIYPMIMASIAVIVYGSTLLISSSTTAQMNNLLIEHTQTNRLAGVLSRQAVIAAAGVQILIGIAAVILGILALTGLEPLILSLVAILAIGVSALLSGSALAGRFISLFSPRTSLTGRA